MPDLELGVGSLRGKNKRQLISRGTWDNNYAPRLKRKRARKGNKKSSNGSTNRKTREQNEVKSLVRFRRCGKTTKEKTKRDGVGVENS